MNHVAENLKKLKRLADVCQVAILKDESAKRNGKGIA